MKRLFRTLTHFIARLPCRFGLHSWHYDDTASRQCDVCGLIQDRGSTFKYGPPWL
jgi:hypothetical protein